MTVATSCTQANDLRARPGIAPERVGAAGHVCPESHPVAVRAGLAYPPGHPSEPAFDDGPERCFHSISEANAAGFRTAAPPPGSVLVDDIYLVPTNERFLEGCRTATGEISLPVACPMKLPAGGGVLPSTDGIAARFEGGFPVPPGHDPESETHLWIVSAPLSEPDEVGCSRVLNRQRTTVRGRAAVWIECGEGSEIHGGHVILRWTIAAGLYAVSLHGTTATNRRIVRAIAEYVRLVGPTAERSP